MDLMSILMVQHAKLHNEQGKKVSPDKRYKKSQLNSTPKTVNKVNSILSDYHSAKVCDYCDGTGEIQKIKDGHVYTHVCTVCGGSGVVESNETLKVDD